MKKPLLILKLNRWDDRYRSLYAWCELSGRYVEVSISQGKSLDDVIEAPEVNWPAIGAVCEADAAKFAALVLAAVEAAREVAKIADWKQFRLPKGWSSKNKGDYPHVKLGARGPILLK